MILLSGIIECGASTEEAFTHRPTETPTPAPPPAPPDVRRCSLGHMLGLICLQHFGTPLLSFATRLFSSVFETQLLSVAHSLAIIIIRSTHVCTDFTYVFVYASTYACTYMCMYVCTMYLIFPHLTHV
eukprot:GHVU01158400.1.p1 GENE.GHVU01158400.1~~GHVU01158400.1.p1  ORF type:complete len:128 (+),score=0.77 GHVU01158400.1:452-835(+)